MAAPVRVPADCGGAAEARPFGAGASGTAVQASQMYGSHVVTGAVPYVSDAPYVAPSYNERSTCIGTRTNGQPCKAKADEGHQHCGSHLNQE